MTSRKIIWTLLAAITVLAMVLMGCSSKKFTNSSSGVSENADPTVYVPLEQGWRISYTELEPTTQHYDIEVTDPVTVNGYAGYTIRRTNRDTFEQTVSYMYATNDAIYETQSTTDQGVKILESPFIVGKTWDRVGIIENDGNDKGDVGDTIVDGNGDNQLYRSDIGHPAYNTMRIVAKEDIAALDGHTYANCLKIEWQSSEYTYNYFWYAAGIGLVKYQNVPNNLSASENNTVSVMSAYSQVEY